MRKIPPKVILLHLLLWVTTVYGQIPTTRLQARELEWNRYAIPKTPFKWLVSKEKDFLVRIPVDWKQQNSELIFVGPHSAQLQVFAEKIPDGMSLQEYVGAILRVAQDQSQSPDSIVARRTRIQDIEAREIIFETPDVDGETIRMVLWVCVRGPLALVLRLRSSVSDAAQVEPDFKAVVQSLMLVNKYQYQQFEQRGDGRIKTQESGPIDKLQSIVTTLEQPGIDRRDALAQLTSIFASRPEVALELLIDRRPLIRAAATEAIARSQNPSLEPWLWEAIGDPDSIVAEHAARAIATLPNVVSLLPDKSFSGLRFEVVARVWRFLPQQKRRELLQLIFSRTAIPSPLVVSVSPNPKVIVSVGELSPVKPGLPPPASETAAFSFSLDPTVQLGAITLLKEVSTADFKLPLGRIVAANHDPLTTAALQIALEREEVLPVQSLIPLLSSKSSSVRLGAARLLGLSATAAELPSLEQMLATPTTPGKGKEQKTGGSDADFNGELRLTIKKVRFRNQLATASPETLDQLEKQAQADPLLAEFVWQQTCKHQPKRCPAAEPLSISNLQVKPYGENLLPNRLEHFVSLKNPEQTAASLYDSLHGIQMESARAQASLALVLTTLRALIAQQLAAPPEESLLEYTGINMGSPITFARWTTRGAPTGAVNARREAIVLRVKDQALMERLISGYQRSFNSSFAELTDSIAVGTRLLAALPAVLPLSAKGILSPEPEKAKKRTILLYSSTDDSVLNGWTIRTFENTRVTDSGEIKRATTHLLMLGDTAVLSPNLSTLAELLSEARNNTLKLDGDGRFIEAVHTDGDVVYFSDLNLLLGGIGVGSGARNPTATESGALTVSKGAWENTHRFTFKKNEWSKALFPFHPRDLSSPRELLPKSTLGYYVMKIDVRQLWQQVKPTLPDAREARELAAVCKLDLEQEVLQELGPECGFALFDFTDLSTASPKASWAAFCKLRSTKLEQALNTSLLNSEKLKDGVAEIPFGNKSLFVSTKAGYLVAASTANALAAFDEREKLASTRDYSKSAEGVPDGIIAFGGYNLEAAIDQVGQTVDGLRAQQAAVVTMLAKAFHSQRMYAVASSGSVEAKSRVSMDREGRYGVAEMLSGAVERTPTYATIAPRGLSLGDRERVSHLVLKVHAKSEGIVERIREDIQTTHQNVVGNGPLEMTVTTARRRVDVVPKFQLPITNPELANYLLPSREIPSKDPEVVRQAKEIAGNDRDAWSVARKLAEWTHKNLQWKFVANADPSQTLATREADCSEFSQLYVAMARSLGLPARIVSGLAFTGNAFGGHAWVEVWAGQWIEVDPTWGTDFVDATHIRNQSGALITFAALNAIELEVVEARREVAPYQTSAKALAEKLSFAIPSRDSSVVMTALDLEVLTDEFRGNGTWTSMTAIEHEQMSAAYRRLLLEITAGYGKTESSSKEWRLLHFAEDKDTAEATYLCAPDNLLIKARLFRRVNTWYLREILQVDTALAIVAETLRPAVMAIEDRRHGRNSSALTYTDPIRVMMLMQKDVARALAAAEQALAQNPSDNPLRFVKALALLSAEKPEEARIALQQLARPEAPYAPALYKLAQLDRFSDDPTKREPVIALYKRYLLLEPYDVRAYVELAETYENAELLDEAEVAYRKSVELDPLNSQRYLDLAHLLSHQRRWKDVDKTIGAAERHKLDVFAELMNDLYVLDDDVSPIVELAQQQPLRFSKSLSAHLTLARVHFGKGQKMRAITLARKAVPLDSTSTEPYLVLAEFYRKMSRWSAALLAADEALALDAKSSDAHYHRACALARLGRRTQAIAALSRAIELDPSWSEWLEEEDDLRPLARLPEFIKLTKASEPGEASVP